MKKLIQTAVGGLFWGFLGVIGYLGTVVIVCRRWCGNSIYRETFSDPYNREVDLGKDLDLSNVVWFSDGKPYDPDLRRVQLNVVEELVEPIPLLPTCLMFFVESWRYLLSLFQKTRLADLEDEPIGSIRHDPSNEPPDTAA